MKPHHLLACAVALGVSACATPTYISPVEVTRFVGNAPAQLGTGTISLQAAQGIDDTPDLAAFRAALADELESLGYEVVLANGAQTGAITLQQNVALPGDDRGPVSVGGGASAGSYGSGVGLGIGIDLTPREAERIETFLALAIRANAGGPNLWEGRASMSVSANSTLADQHEAAARLAAALLTDFPGQSGETIIVE